MHWAFTFQTRLKTRLGLWAKGLSFSQINHKIWVVDDPPETGWEHFVKVTAAQNDIDIPEFEADAQNGVVGADGSILKQILDAITAFLASPQGQALIAALIAALIGGL